MKKLLLLSIGLLLTACSQGETFGGARVFNESQGGTATSTFVMGDILYSDAANSLSSLPIGSVGQVLKIAGGLPGWGTDNTGGVGGSGYAEFTSVGNNQQNVSSTPFLFVNGLYASTTALFANTTIYGTGSSTVTLYAPQIGVGSDYFTDLTGTGLAISNQTLVPNLTGGTGITFSNPTVSFDSTEVEATTWGAGGNVSNLWTFNLSGTDPTLTFQTGGFLFTGKTTSTVAMWLGIAGSALFTDSTGGDLFAQGGIEAGGGIFASGVSTTTATTTIGNGLKVYKIDSTTTLEFL